MQKKWYHISLFTIFCILLNYCGKYISAQTYMPFWLDSVGTAFEAYALGPVCGAIVGISVNLIYGLHDPISLIYALTNASIGITIGLCAKKKLLDTFLNMVSTCTLTTFIATAISTPINCIHYDGYTGNIWGDGIFEMLTNLKINWIFSAVVAEFFLDFLDKLITLLLLFVAVRVYRKIRTKIKTKASVTTILILACMAFLQPMKAQAAEEYDAYIQTVYSKDNGMMSGEANDVVATDDGVLWIGTYAGLYRYSGSDFTYMNELETVKNVNCLYVDAEGRMWIGTNDDGLSTFVHGEIVNTFNENRGLPANSVRSIVQQSGGDYFVGTSSSLAIVRLSGGMELYKTFSRIKYAHSLAADRLNHVAAVTNSGDLFLLEGSEIVCIMKAPLQETNYRSCTFTESGLLYVATDNHLIYVYEVIGASLKQKQIIDCKELTVINSMKELESGEIFLCADNGIGYIDTMGMVNILNTGNFNNSIDNMTVDYQGNMWFASSRLGVMKLYQSAFTEIFAQANIDKQVVNTITKWNGLLYFGTDNGLIAMNKKFNQQVENRLTELLATDRIRCLMVDSHNNLWICSYTRGTICVDPAGNMSFFDKDNGALGTKFRSCIEMEDGTIVLSADSGITLIRDKEVIGTIGASDGLNTPMILCMLPCPDGSFLAGSDGGGIYRIVDGKITQNITRLQGLSSGVILRMARDEDHDAVFIVTSNGICYMDKNGEIRELSYFPYSNNYDIYDDGYGKLFVTGSAGIYVVDKESLLNDQKPEYELLNYLSGLRGSFTANAWNYVENGKTWYIAGNTGATKLDFENYHAEKRSYRMIVNSVILDDSVHLMNGEKTIVVGSKVSHIEFLPEIINYSTDDPYVRYYLEGVDEEAIIVRQSELSTIYYNNLPTGTHLFHLAIVDDNQYVIEEMLYTIKKEAEIYDNPWFKVLFVFELMIIVAWFTWFIARLFIQRTLELQRREIALAKEQINMGNETIMAIAKTVDAKDSNTSDHSARVAQYSVVIGERLGYSQEECENLRKAALLHDIGKIGIPDRVLNKSAKLSDEEYAVMKTHVIKGADILKDFSLIPHVQEGAKYHHERYDGRGYVEGLKGEDIPEYARIIGLSDAFDAMTANRVYRKRLDWNIVLDEVRKGRGTQFDPKLVDILLELIDEGVISEKSVYGEDGENK